MLTPVGSVSLLTLHGDNDTWSVTVFGASGDAPLKALRDPECFARVVASYPIQAHWLDGEAVTGVLPMAGILDRHRRLAADGRPVVTGFVAVGDAWACTNPSAGRGLSVGLMHAQLLRHTWRRHLDDPASFARVFDERTEELVAPYFRDQVTADRARIAEMSADRSGRAAPPPRGPMARLAAAAPHDADAFRGLLEIAMCLALPDEVLSRPAVMSVVDGADDPPSLAGPGPDREGLLQLLAG
jgi:2-polyprenyl-6-methoxyphenol hydroxylase-like FAD-dependent oxidoreductase